TLSWRWVAGLQTQGKVYAATASNIHKFTDGRFHPGHGLTTNPAPLKGSDHPPRGPAPQGDLVNPDAPSVLVLHDDDLSPGFILDQGVNIRATGFVQRTAWRTPLEMAPAVTKFVANLGTDCFERYGDKLGQTATLDITDVLDWAAGHGAHQIVTPFAPIGPNADMVRHLKHKAADRGMDVLAVMRPYDAMCWPHATHGFFRFKEHIPKLIEHL
ncbi:MAG: DNA photolyase, partial [Pseudomonadota bacterium]